MKKITFGSQYLDDWWRWIRGEESWSLAFCTDFKWNQPQTQAGSARWRKTRSKVTSPLGPWVKIARRRPVSDTYFALTKGCIMALQAISLWFFQGPSTATSLKSPWDLRDTGSCLQKLLPSDQKQASLALHISKLFQGLSSGLLMHMIWAQADIANASQKLTLSGISVRNYPSLAGHYGRSIGRTLISRVANISDLSKGFRWRIKAF